MSLWGRIRAPTLSLVASLGQEARPFTMMPLHPGRLPPRHTLLPEPPPCPDTSTLSILSLSLLPWPYLAWRLFLGSYDSNSGAPSLFCSWLVKHRCKCSNSKMQKCLYRPQALWTSFLHLFPTPRSPPCRLQATLSLWKVSFNKKQSPKIGPWEENRGAGCSCDPPPTCSLWQKWFQLSLSNFPVTSPGPITLQDYQCSWRRKWQPTPVFLLGEFHRQRNLVGSRPWGSKEYTWLHD